MNAPDSDISPPLDRFDSSELDLTVLVGHFIELHSRQFPGQLLSTRVLNAQDQVITVDRSGNASRIDSLVHNQPVTVRFEYKGEQIAVQALLKRRQGGQCSLHFGPAAEPLTRRRFTRADFALPVKMAVLPLSVASQNQLHRLRWMETESINFSSGGVMLELGSYLEDGSYLLMNVSLDRFDFPALIIGQVRHCHQLQPGKYIAGIEFVLTERQSDHFSLSLRRALPQAVFSYDWGQCLRLNRNVSDWLRDQDIEDQNRSLL